MPIRQQARTTQPQNVWNVRENVRYALESTRRKFNNLKDVLAYVSSKFDIGLTRWIRSSKLLQELLYQTRITDF
jgi:hypothetical protein